MTHRNRQLLDLCHEAPCCLQLGHEGCGKDPSVPCHSDMIRHGRGASHKSHDCFAVPGCPVCHEYFKRSVLGREGYLEAWLAAMERYILWLWVAQRIRVVTKRDTQKEPSMEATMCKICNQRHWAREPHILPADAPAEKRSKRILSSGGIKADPAEVPDDYAGGSADAVIAGAATFAAMGESPERKPGPNRAQNGLTARRDGKNTSREGRRVLKAEGESPDATRSPATAKPEPTTPPGIQPGRRTKADKARPGKPKTAAKKRRKL